MVEKTPKRKERIWYGQMPVWRDGWIVGRASLSIIYRGCWRQNLHVGIYSKGKYPHYKSANLEESYTVRIPLPVSADIIEELKKRDVRIQHKESHRWIKKVYRAKVKPPVVAAV